MLAQRHISDQAQHYRSQHLKMQLHSQGGDGARLSFIAFLTRCTLGLQPGQTISQSLLCKKAKITHKESMNEEHQHTRDHGHAADIE